MSNLETITTAFIYNLTNCSSQMRELAKMNR
ncbi:hypothetical protein T12_2612 [Trichinella patagoniensis]|uniref:Uncharacterized protein n=1 Tax=Trichinella patagoniensis TaxID=990121 RepID=A0A0V0YY64_9BILA|nr:hypothetical protein T12_15777 [Trichinella patagoniensis]KRY05214.1 hypothetical protein T12_2612 [Trichinella patagoniensis]